MKEKVFKLDSAKDVKEFWNNLDDEAKEYYRPQIKAAQKQLCSVFKEKCWLRGQDDLIEYQKTNIEGPYYSDEAVKTVQEKRDVVYVYPYEYDQSNPVEKQFCPICNLESIVGAIGDEILNEARKKEKFLKEQRLNYQQMFKVSKNQLQIFNNYKKNNKKNLKKK